MTISVEALLVVSLMMAVFAAVSTVGTSLFLGAGFERLRSGFETIKKQTAFFSEQIHKLDQRVDTVEKQSGYFFQAITDLEQQAAAPKAEQAWDDARLATEEKRLVAKKNDSLHVDLLTANGFISQQPSAPAPQESLRERFLQEARKPESRMHFH